MACVKSFPGILVQLDNLEDLYLENEIKISDNFISNSKFKLKKLDYTIENRMREFTRFIRAQPDLESLSICVLSERHQIIGAMGPFMEAILTLENLEYLDIFVSDESGVQESYIDIDAPANLSIKHFHLDYDCESSFLAQDSIFFRKMMQKMPNLETLDTRDSSILFRKEDANFLNDSKMLKKICIRTTTVDCVLAELNFPNLVEVSLRFDEPDDEGVPIIDTEELIKFLKTHPNLKKLNVMGANIEEKVWDCIKKNLHCLETFKFGISKIIFPGMPFIHNDPEFEVQSGNDASDNYVELLYKRIKRIKYY